MSQLRRSLLLCITVALSSLPLNASMQWDKKAHAEWSEKDALKVLNDSPWGRTQTFSSTLTQFRGPATGAPSSQPANPPRPPDATHIFFRVRFFSAKPIRLAVGRMLELNQKQPMSQELSAHIRNLTSGEFLEYIVITVSCESQDAGANVQEALALLRSRGTANLKNNTFLEIKGGKRLFLQEYQQPRPDGLGARFLFPRLVDGKPFITPESEEIRFFSELNSTYRLDRRYKTKDMMYEGKLEY